MEKMKRILWGIILVVLGVVIGLKTTGVVDFNIFFDGWWTLFIIVPSFVGLFGSTTRKEGIIGLLIGVVLLLVCQDVINFRIIRMLLVPAIIIIVGLMLIFKDSFNKGARMAAKKFRESGTNKKEFCATFSSDNVNFAEQPLENIGLTAVFGSINCDLRGAVITGDAVVEVSSIFGSVDIFVPDNVNVKISATSIFGGTSDKRTVKNVGCVNTIYINSTCLFGGADIK